MILRIAMRINLITMTMMTMIYQLLLTIMLRKIRSFLWRLNQKQLLKKLMERYYLKPSLLMQKISKKQFLPRIPRALLLLINLKKRSLQSQRQKRKKKKLKVGRREKRMKR
jgi:hypothetical protein